MCGRGTSTNYHVNDVKKERRKCFQYHVLLTALVGVDVCTNVSARMLRLQDEITVPSVACTRRTQRRRKRRAPQRQCAACHIRQGPYRAPDRRSVHRAPPCSKVCAGRRGAGRHGCSGALTWSQGSQIINAGSGRGWELRGFLKHTAIHGRLDRPTPLT